MKKHVLFLQLILLLFVFCNSSAMHNDSRLVNLNNQLKTVINNLRDRHRASHTDLIGKLIAAGADKNARFDDGLTPLLLAALHGNYDVVTRLLLCDADATLTNNRGFSIVHCAVASGQNVLVNYILWFLKTRHPDIFLSLLHSRALDGITPILMAAQRGYLDIVHTLAMFGANLDERDARDFSLLHNAARSGNEHLVLYLCGLKIDLQSGRPYFDPNIRARDNTTPLMIAALHGKADVVRMLVQYGGDLAVHDNAGFGIMHHAVYGGNPQVLKFILNVRDSSGNFVVNINDQSVRGDTAFMLAAQLGDIEALRIIFDCRGRIRNMNDYGHRIQYGLRDCEGAHILHYAAISDDSAGSMARTSVGIILALLGELIQDGIFSIDERTYDGRTPLMYAAALGRQNAIRLLAASGANVRATNNAGCQAVHMALRNNHYAAADQLLSLSTSGVLGKTCAVERL